MFANLFGKRAAVRREADKIWKTRRLEFEGLLAELAALNREARRPLVVAQFPATFRALADLFTARAVAFESYPTPLEGARLRDPAEYRFPDRLLLALAPALPAGLAAARPQPPAACGFEIHLLVAEHHPLAAFDDGVLAFAAGLPCPCRAGFHDALDGVLLQRFGGAQIVQWMETLNMPEGEYISHPSVDQSIRLAQAKIARRVSNPLAADSAEQWFQQHLPEEK